MMRRGFTVVELVIALATASVIGLVSAALFAAGMKTYNYTNRQTVALTAASNAFDGRGTRLGMAWMTRTAASVQTLSATSLEVVSSTGVVTTFSVSGGALRQASSLGTSFVQAAGVESLQLNYYNLDDSGLIMESTAAAAATFVTFRVKLSAASGSQKQYDFYTGTQLRNHQ